jgi:hypothetical protein
VTIICDEVSYIKDQTVKEKTLQLLQCLPVDRDKLKEFAAEYELARARALSDHRLTSTTQHAAETLDCLRKLCWALWRSYLGQERST